MDNSKEFNILGKKCLISFPKCGQLMEIEAMKLSLSNNKYGVLVSTKTMQSSFLLDLIDAFSYFSTLSPTFKKMLETMAIDNPEDLDYRVGKKLTTVYTKEFWPWFSEIQSSIDKEFDVISKEKQDLTEELSEKK